MYMQNPGVGGGFFLEIDLASDIVVRVFVIGEVWFLSGNRLRGIRGKEDFVIYDKYYYVRLADTIFLHAAYRNFWPTSFALKQLLYKRPLLFFSSCVTPVLSPSWQSSPPYCVVHPYSKSCGKSKLEYKPPDDLIFQCCSCNPYREAEMRKSHEHSSTHQHRPAKKVTRLYSSYIYD